MPTLGIISVLIPVWQEFHPNQNSWFKSGLTPHLFVGSNNNPLNQAYALNKFSGNESAASWSTTLPLGGSPVWGNNQFVQTVCQALGIVHMMPFM